MSEAVRTRFAPSPTGLMHLGNTRSALINYIFAKHHNGSFILRIEDTDQERYNPKSEIQFHEVVSWLGIKPDEGPEIGGGFGPYKQSKRLKIYQHIANDLVDRGLAYRSNVPSEYIEELRKNTKGTFVLKHELIQDKIDDKDPEGPIRIKIPETGSISWSDELRGDYTQDLSTIEDFILIKSDGYPTYNFANIIDDNLMEISHVIRGDEYIASTAKYCFMYDLLEYPRPKYIHLPQVQGEDKTKLSKRKGAKDVLEYRDLGYLKESILNALVLLGLSIEDNVEIKDLDDVIKNFKTEKLLKSPSVFNDEKLDWISKQYIQKLDNDIYIKEAMPFIRDNILNSEYKPDSLFLEELNNTEYLEKVLILEKSRIKAFSELGPNTEYFFRTVNGKLSEVFDDQTVTMIKPILLEFAESLVKGVDIDSLLKETMEKHNLKTPELMMPLRQVLTNQKMTPSIGDIIKTLPLSEVKKRIEKNI